VAFRKKKKHSLTANSVNVTSKAVQYGASTKAPAGEERQDIDTRGASQQLVSQQTEREAATLAVLSAHPACDERKKG
jgi:hypothetical protein